MVSCKMWLLNRIVLAIFFFSPLDNRIVQFYMNWSTLKIGNAFIKIYPFQHKNMLIRETNIS